jgi:hypothetical protein
METGRLHAATILLTVLGIVLALPPVWSLFE